MCCKRADAHAYVPSTVLVFCLMGHSMGDRHHREQQSPTRILFHIVVVVERAIQYFPRNYYARYELQVLITGEFPERTGALCAPLHGDKSHPFLQHMFTLCGSNQCRHLLPVRPQKAG
jgi:hypothetical protein